MEKKRVIKDYEKLSEEICEQIKLTYPNGYSQNLIRFTDKNKKRISALPFETEDIYYLVRMTMYEAQTIIEEDDDYDEEGMLRDEPREEYEDKHADIDEIDDIADSSSLDDI
ncbi:MAG: hypothetical protein PF484_12050 [Bacteroidales bacterium]|jgi:hypothetical protein|nr:hypothetical protein [Bacteroidales bacterium]